MNSGIIKIRLKAYDSSLLDSSTLSIVSRVSKTGTKIKGPIPLPVKIQRFTVNRSTHVDKKSREHFEIRRYKRLLILMDSSPQTVEALMRLELPAGVDVKLEVNEGVK